MSSFPLEPREPSPEHVSGGRRRNGFVTACQHLMALAVVVAVLTPAARTVTMDVQPVTPLAPTDVALRSAEFPSKVPTEPVSTDVDQYALTAPDGSARSRSAVRATSKVAAGGREQIVSDVVPVDGYGAVGVTWSQGDAVDDDAIGVQVRTQTDGIWSGWEDVEYHDEHGPDPSTKEGREARPGTDALLVGDVDAVQVKVATDEAAPADMKLAVIDPGTTSTTAVQKPAIDTAKLASTASAGTGTGATAPAEGSEDTGTESTGTDGTEGTGTEGTEELDLQATVFTPKPKIYSRAQWGANESLRDKSSLTYYEVHGGFVHHTVNANNYTAAEVPGIIRAIYSYHVKTRGWSDIGYNFLVDRFGRIWEGRAGGVDRPVVGAHTLGYNNYSFAMSAIGNYETASPTSAMLNAYGALFAWKLSLHGVDAASTSQRIGSKYFPAVNGHRDAGSTACPGRYLYAKIGRIRELASAAQKGWSGREIVGNYMGSSHPDLLARRISDGRLLVLQLGQNADGQWAVVARKNTGIPIRWASHIMRGGDWDRDGHNDIVARRASDGAIYLLRGKGGGAFLRPVLLTNKLKGRTLISVPGDVTGDGYPDLMAQVSGTMRIYPGIGGAGLGTSSHNLGASYPAYSAVKGTAVVPAGLVNGDGAPDALVRDGASMKLYLGNGPGGWTSSQRLEVSASGYDFLVGVGRVGSNGYSDYVARVASNGQLLLLSGKATGWSSTKVRLGSASGVNLLG